jgi:hypothetical protein
VSLVKKSMLVCACNACMQGKHVPLPFELPNRKLFRRGDSDVWLPSQGVYLWLSYVASFCSLLVKACISPWVEALHLAIHLTIPFARIPSCSVLAGQCRYPMHGRVPNDIHLLRTCGLLCDPDILDAAPHKLSPRSLPCVF